MGLDQPAPTVVRQEIFKPPGGKVFMMPVSFQAPSRFGPRHCGQSSARAVKHNNTDKPSATAVEKDFLWFMIKAARQSDTLAGASNAECPQRGTCRNQDKFRIAFFSRRPNIATNL